MFDIEFIIVVIWYFSDVVVPYFPKGLFWGKFTIAIAVEPYSPATITRYGVKIKASAPTLHIFRVDVDNTFEPILGSKEQSEAMIEYLTENEESLVNVAMFGRNIGDLLKDGINAKLITLPDNNRTKLQNILKSMTNKGKNNLIAIVF